MLQNHQIAAQLREKGIDPDVTGSDLNSFSGVDPMGGLSHGLDILSIPGSLMAEAVEGIFNKGDKEFNFMDAMPGFSGDFSFTNPKGEPTKFVSNTIGMEDSHWLPKLAVDMFTDPTTYVGAGIIKNLVKKGVTKAGVKQLPKNIYKTKRLINPTFDDIMKLPDDEFRTISGSGKQYWELVGNKKPESRS